MSLSSNKSAGRKGPSSMAASSDAPLRGVFVHRMGEKPEDERQVAKFWREHGLHVDAIEDARERFSKLPDLCLSYDRKAWAYCEVKTIARHFWKVRILHDDRPIDERFEESKKSVIERLTGDLVTAARQLKAGNADHALLNFVVLVNRDEEASPSLLTQLFSKTPASAGRSLKVRRESAGEGDQGFRRNVDFAFGSNQPLRRSSKSRPACC